MWNDAGQGSSPQPVHGPRAGAGLATDPLQSVWRSRTLLYVQGALGVPVVMIGLALAVADAVDGTGFWAVVGMMAVGLGIAFAAISFNLAAKVKSGRAGVRTGILVLEFIVVGLQVLELLGLAALATLVHLENVSDGLGPAAWVIWLFVFWIPTGTAPPVIAPLLAMWILRVVIGAEAKAWFQRRPSTT